MTTQFVLALGLLCCLVAGESIVSLKLNKAEGQMYALSTGTEYWLYELDNVAVVQNNQHSLNTSSPPTVSSAYIKTINGQKSLFQVLSDVFAYGTQLSRFDLPFGNAPSLTPAAITTSAIGYTGVPTAFDNKDLIAVTISNGKYLNLFDLPTINKTDTVTIFNGLRRGATAVIYNYKNNRAVVFWYQYMQSSYTYSMIVSEYEVVDKKLVEVTTSYPSTASTTTFNDSRAVYGAFDASNNKYWILDDQSLRLVRFNSGNLGVYSFIPLGVISFDSGISTAVYNFGSQLAYVLSDAPHGFYLQEVDLADGTIRRAATFDTGDLDVSSAELDVEEGNLYVGLINGSTGPATLSVIDLGNLSQEIITLTH